MKPDFVTHFREGLAHFNNTEFWEAHESWEVLWLVAESDVEQFLQGLIQLAAAYHHIKRGTLRGAPRLFEAALRRLAAFPPAFGMIDRSKAEAAARAHHDWVAALVARDESGELADWQFPEMALLG